MDEDHDEVDLTPASSPEYNRTSENAGLDPVGVMIGLIVIALGLWLLGNIFKLIPGTVILPLPVWAGILAVGGAIMAGTSRKMLIPGLILAIVSASYFFRYFGLFAVDGFHKIWLVLLILVGLMMVASSRQKV